jgi:hypothetical protein
MRSGAAACKMETPSYARRWVTRRGEAASRSKAGGGRDLSVSWERGVGRREGTFKMCSQMADKETGAEALE